MLEDIAILTGGTVISEEEDILREYNYRNVKVCKKVTIDKDNSS
jgi:chaperonin GroEL (HSP60 family)